MSPTSYLTAPPRGGAVEFTKARNRSALRGANVSQSLLKYAKTSDLARERAHARRPLAQLRLGVVAAAAAAAVVEAQVGEIRGQDLRRRLPAAVVVDHERGAVLAQQLPHRLGEPARVAQLERVAARRQVRERVGEAVVVAARSGRAAATARGRASATRPAARSTRSSAPTPRSMSREPLHVRQVAAGLDREHEVRRRVVHPAVDRRGLREPVEGRVDLDGVEAGGVVLEPPPRRQARRVEGLPPALVLASPSSRCARAGVSRSADLEPHDRPLLAAVGGRRSQRDAVAPASSSVPGVVEPERGEVEELRLEPEDAALLAGAADRLGVVADDALRRCLLLGLADVDPDLARAR